MLDTFFNNLFNSVSLYDIILFIVSGYYFTGVFKFVTEVKKPSTDLQSLVLDLIVGFTIKSICKTIPFRTKISSVNIVGYICICILSGYLIGLLYNSSFFQIFLSKLKIRTSTKSQIWKVITDHEESLWVTVGYKELDLKYYGFLRCYDGDEKYPQIALYGYSKGSYDQDLKKNPSEDYTGKMSKFVLLDTSKADIIEFTSTNETRKRAKKESKKKTKIKKQKTKETNDKENKS